jgi:HlyD family secretion protein
VVWAFGYFSSEHSNGGDEEKPNSALSVSTASITRGSIKGQTHLTGTVESADPYQVMPTVGGKLVSLPISEGSKVKAGQVLATLLDSDGTLAGAAASAQSNLVKAKQELNTLEDPTADTLQVAQAKAAVKSAQEVLDNARRDLDKAQKKYDEAKDKANEAEDEVDHEKDKAKKAAKKASGGQAASPSGSASGSAGASANSGSSGNAAEDPTSDLNEAMSDLTKAEAKRDAAKTNRDQRQDAVTKAEESLHSAERTLKTYHNIPAADDTKVSFARSQVKAAQTQFDIARRNLASLTVKAPATGTVTSVPQLVGSMVNATTVLAQIDTGGFEVTASTDAAVAAALHSHPSLPVSVTINGTKVMAKVKVVAPTTNSASDQTKVTFTLIPGKTVIRPGSTAGVDIDMPDAKGLVVPASAIVNDDKDTVLYVTKLPEGTGADPASRETTVRRVTVSLGAADATHAVVFGEGLDAESLVVTTGQTQLNDGAKVQILPNQPESSQ